MMNDCWSALAHHRPRFNECVKRLTTIRDGENAMSDDDPKLSDNSPDNKPGQVDAIIEQGSMGSDAAETRRSTNTAFRTFT